MRVTQASLKVWYPAVQFLEQKYGYYHCKDCNIRWESAYVWCVQGTSKVRDTVQLSHPCLAARCLLHVGAFSSQVYFKQFCRVCQKSYNPYRVEDITCQVNLTFAFWRRGLVHYFEYISWKRSRFPVALGSTFSFLLSFCFWLGVVESPLHCEMGVFIPFCSCKTCLHGLFWICYLLSSTEGLLTCHFHLA